MRAAWRERLFTALLVIVVAVPVGIVIGGGLQVGRDPDPLDLTVAADADAETTTTASTTSTTTTSAPATTTTAPQGRAPAEIGVRFSNGSRTAGAAVAVGTAMKARGYDVRPPAPSPPRPIAATTITYRDGFAAEAAALAGALGLPDLRPTPAAGALTPRVDVDVVLADDAVAGVASPAEP